MPDAAESPSLSSDDRRRAYSAVFIGVAVSTTGFLAANTVNTLIAEDLTGSASWSGVPSAASVLGTAIGTTVLAALIRRFGPRRGLTFGYALAMLAIVISGYAIVSRNFALFVVAMFGFGMGYGANRLARYAVADMYPAERRGTMIGWIVWASTIGAVAGPALLAPSRGLAELVALDGIIGPYLVCMAAHALAAIAMLSAPRRMDARIHLPAGAAARPGPSIRQVLADAPVTLALVSMVSGQFVMVLLMTMTPLHIRHEGHGLGAIGLVIAAHTLGMYALSPITSRLSDRFGRVPLLVAGVIVLVTACLVGVAAAAGSYPLLVLGLLLLGVGWNLGFVGGSALLTDSLAPGLRTRVQGLGDTFIWGGGAIASISSGWMLEHAGFAVLSACGAALALAPIVPLLRPRAARGRARQPALGWSPERGGRQRPH